VDNSRIRPYKERVSLEHAVIVSEPRSHQSEYLPGSVKGRGQQLIQEFSETLISDGFPLANGEVVVHAIVTESSNKDLIVSEVEWGVFVDTFTTGGCLIPYLYGISTQDLADWQIIAPHKSVLQTLGSDDIALYQGTTQPKGKSSERMVLRNISAGNVTVYFINQIKYIANNTSGAASS